MKQIDVLGNGFEYITEDSNKYVSGRQINSISLEHKWNYSDDKHKLYHILKISTSGMNNFEIWYTDIDIAEKTYQSLKVISF